MADTRIGGVYVDIKARNAQFLRATKQTLKSFNIQRREFRALRRDAQQFSRTLKGIRTNLLAFGSVGAAIGFVKPFADFQDVLFRVRATLGLTTEEYEKLSQVTQNLGRQTRFTATDAARGAQLLATAGFKVHQINASLAGVLDTALIGNTDLASAANIVASTLGAFQLTAADSSKIVDVLTKSTTTANLTITDFFETSKDLAPIANKLGIDFEQMSASIAVLADAGIKGTKANTALSNAFLRLQGPVAAGEKVLRDYGIALSEVNITELGIEPVIKRLSEANIALEDLKQLVGKQSAAGFSILLDNFDKFENKIQVFREAEGAAADFAAQLEGSVTDSFLKLISALQGFAIAFTTESGLGQLVANITADIGDTVNEFTDDISEVSQRIIHIFTVIAVAVGIRILQIVAAMARIPITLGTIAASSNIALNTVRLGFANLSAAAHAAAIGVRTAIGTMAASTASSFTSIRTAAVSASAGLTGFQAAVVATRTAASTGFAALAASGTSAFATLRTAAIAFGGTMRVAVGGGILFAGRAMALFIRIARLFLPFLLIEAIIRIGQYMFILAREATDVGTSFSDAGILIAINFTANVLKAMIYLAGVVPAAATGIILAVTNIFSEGGEVIFDAFVGAITGDRDAFTGIRERLREVSRESANIIPETLDRFEDDARNLAGLVRGQLITWLGIDEASVQAAEEAAANAGTRTWDSFLSTWGLDPEGNLELEKALKDLEDQIGNGGLTPDQDALIAELLAELERLSKGTKDGFDGATASANVFLDTIKDINEAYNSRQNDLDNEAVKLQLTRREYEKFQDVAKGYSIVQQNANKLSIEQQETLLKLVKERTQALDAYYETLDQAEAEAAQLENIKGIVGDIGDAFGGFARDVLVNFKSIGEAAEALGRRIFAALIEALIIQPLVSGITAGLGAAFGVPGLQSGGFSGTGFRVVGEAGPELVDFRNPGRVYTNSELQSALSGGGGGYEINFSPVIQTQDSTAVRQALAEAYPIFEQRTIQTIETLVSRPSNFRRSLGG